MAGVGRVRWRMLALMLAGTIVIYVDRNTLGALAPILKKELELHHRAIFLRRLVRSRSFIPSRNPSRAFSRILIGPRLGYAVAAVIWGGAAALHGLSTGWLSMAAFRGAAGLERSRGDPDGDEGLDDLVSNQRALDRDRLVQLRLVDRRGAYAAARHLSRNDDELAVLPSSSPACSASSWRSSGTAFYRDPQVHPELSEPERELYSRGPAARRRDETLVGKGSLRAAISRHSHRALPDRAGLADVPVLDPALHGDGAPYGHQTIRAVRLGCRSSPPISVACSAAIWRPWLANRFTLEIVNARLTTISIGAFCMVGPALISFVVDPIVAILCFSLGGFAHQMLSSMMYALMGDVFDKTEVATATGVAGMFGYLGGALFTLAVGRLADTGLRAAVRHAVPVRSRRRRRAVAVCRQTAPGGHAIPGQTKLNCENCRFDSPTP